MPSSIPAELSDASPETDKTTVSGSAAISVSSAAITAKFADVTSIKSASTEATNL